MKKISTITLATMLIIGLCACGIGRNDMTKIWDQLQGIWVHDDDGAYHFVCVSNEGDHTLSWSLRI
jgi:hypothetical protein